MFREGLYEFKYETNSGVQHYIGVVNNIDLHSIMTTIHMFEGNDTQDLVKKWRLSEGDMYKYINTFDNIHEVSKRIKEIEERKDWPVQVGQIWEVSWVEGECHYIVHVDDIIYYTEDQAPSYSVTFLKVITCKYGRKEGKYGKYIGIYPEDENTTLLTQQQYKQRVKELEKEELKKGDWVLIKGSNPQHAFKIAFIEFYDNVFNYGGKSMGSFTDGMWKYEELQKIPELEAICLLTGNKNYELVDDDHDVILRADWNGQEEQIKELQEENKQLRKALVYHGVWPSEDVTPAGQYKEAINMATNSEIVSVTKMEPSEEVKAILPKVNKLQQEAIDSIKTFDFDTGMDTNPPKNFKVDDKEHVLTPNYKDGLLQEVHEILLQLKEKFLS